MDKPRPRVAPRQPEEGWPTTAVGFQHQQRKAKRFVTTVALAVILGPFALGLLALLIAAAGSGTAWSLLGVPFLLLAALASFAVPFLVVAIFVFGAWAIIKAYYRKPPLAPARLAAMPGGAPAHPLAAEITLLEGLRARLAAEARRRTLIFVPLGLAAAALFFFAMTSGGGKSQGSPMVAFIILIVIGGGGAWIWAVSGPSRRYALAFKQQTLPRLLAAYGELRHSIGTKPDLGPAIAAGFLPAHDSLSADDSFTGTYRGRPIRITELEVTRKGGKNNSSKNDETLFQGLYVEITVSAPFRGITVLRDRDGRQPQTGLQRLYLEDPVFDDIYTAWASDQVEGRAVLTPAVMERLLAMADGHSFLPPQFLLDGDSMVFALPSITPGSLFEPPGLESHVAAQQLARLEADLATVFTLADAMIDMHVAVRAPQDRLARPGPAPRNPTP
jgi:hypothetical protein